MKVICVNSSAWPNGYPPDVMGGVIKEGNLYDVITIHIVDDYVWFCLAEDPKFMYWENCFGRVSNIDERELLEQRQTELV